METYFEQDYLRISYGASGHCIVYQWLVPPTEEELKEGCEKMISALIHYKTGKAIVDTRQQGVLHPELVQWMTADWMKRVVKAGYTHEAVVMPNDIFAKISLDAIVNEARNSNVKSYFFDTMEDAIEWIKKQS